MHSAHDELAALERWLFGPRFAGLKRAHGAREVLRHRGTFSYDFTLARNGADVLFTRLRRQFDTGHTVGDGAPHVTASYAAKTDDPAHASEFVQRAAHGGAAAYRVEDSWSAMGWAERSAELHLAPIETLIRQLGATRLALDTHAIPGVVVAVMDADGQLIPRETAVPDRSFLIGATDLRVPSFRAASLALARWLDRSGTRSNAITDSRTAARESISDAEIAEAEAWLISCGAVQLDSNELRNPATDENPFDRLRSVWRREAGAKTFGEAVVELMRWPPPEGDHLGVSPATWRELAQRATFEELQDRADQMGVWTAWDPERAQTLSDDFQVRGGIDLAIARALAAAPYADVLSLRTRSADLEEARRFANAVHAQSPAKPLGYELDASETNAALPENVRAELARCGFVLQTIRRNAHHHSETRGASTLGAVAPGGE